MWSLDPSITFLNHGSFGACPVEVLAVQAELRARMEREPVRFFLRELPPLLDAARDAVAKFVGADAAGLVFVPNATTGVNAVLRSLDLAPGDELVTTDHAYPACRNALAFVAERAGARLVVARLPFPTVEDAGEARRAIVAAIVSATTPRTRLALVDHVTSPTALVLPVADVVAALQQRGIDVLVDGAHAPGMLPLDLEALGAAYYTGNCHKWPCAPKGAAFLHVRQDRRDRVRPTTISHGASADAGARSRLHAEFDWPGTVDPTPWLSLPAALAHMAGLVEGGWPALMQRNNSLCIAARRLLIERLGLAAPCPEALLGSIASLRLPDARTTARPVGVGGWDDLHDRLFDEHAIEVPIFPWPAPPARWVRVSAQMYNCTADYERLAGALSTELAR